MHRRFGPHVDELGLAASRHRVHAGDNRHGLEIG
jgi:hypothetical protein